LYRSAVQPKLPSSSLAVTPPTGHRPFGPPTCRSAPGRTAHRQPSWSFSPLRRVSLSESTSPRFASPGTLRPQGFSPSRRITPRPDVRPYFRPVAPLGFRSSGAYPHRQVPRTLRPTELPSWRFFLFAARPRSSGSRRLSPVSRTCADLFPPSGPCSSSGSVPHTGLI
jgi:hypothetical protein